MNIIAYIVRNKIEVWVKPFQRLAGSKGVALCRSPQTAKFFMLTKNQEGQKNYPVDSFSWETLLRGFPIG